MQRIPFAINGLGRIGRALLRVALARPDLEPVAINDLTPVERLARLLQRDSLHGPLGMPVTVADGDLLIGERRLRVHRIAEPAAIPWQESGPRVVVEATGVFNEARRADAHLRPPVERVVLSANAADADLTVCIGVNQQAYDPRRHRLVSNASCTTNCLAPVVQVLDDRFGVAQAMVSTVHCYNNSQSLLDADHADPRRARAAPLNMIPTTTGSIAALGRVIPRLSGRVAGYAVRVPTADVSLLDVVARLERPARRDELTAAFRRAAGGELDGILGVTEEELVSSDFIGDPRSAIVDLPLVDSLGADLARIVAWYDNEWGYASRLADLVARVGGR